MKKSAEKSTKKPSVKIDIMLSKAMPGIDSKGKQAKKSGTKKGKC